MILWLRTRMSHKWLNTTIENTIKCAIQWMYAWLETYLNTWMNIWLNIWLSVIEHNKRKTGVIYKRHWSFSSFFPLDVMGSYKDLSQKAVTPFDDNSNITQMSRIIQRITHETKPYLYKIVDIFELIHFNFFKTKIKMINIENITSTILVVINWVSIR